MFLYEVQESIFKATLSFSEKEWKITVIWPNKDTAKSSFRRKFVYITVRDPAPLKRNYSSILLKLMVEEKLRFSVPSAGNIEVAKR